MNRSTLTGWMALASLGLACGRTTPSPSTPADSTHSSSATPQPARSFEADDEPTHTTPAAASASGPRLVRDHEAEVRFEPPTHESRSTLLAQFSSQEALDKIDRVRLLASLDSDVSPTTELSVYVRLCPSAATGDPQRAQDTLGELGLNPAKLSGNIARGRVTLERLPQLADWSCVERIELATKVQLRNPRAHPGSLTAPSSAPPKTPPG
ncbi:MAG: hypothetical protein AAGF11_50960 [Myxococcota bacterium]